MCNRGKDRDSCLFGTFIRSNTRVQSLHLIHAPAAFCTLPKPTCVIRPAYAPGPPRPSPHPRAKRSPSFTSYSHPLSTRVALYPRKTSIYARFRGARRFDGGGFHTIHNSRSWLLYCSVSFSDEANKDISQSFRDRVLVVGVVGE